MRGSDRIGTWSTALMALLLAAGVCADATHTCATIANDGERLACYDTAFGRATGPAAPSARSAAPAAAASPPPTAATPPAAPTATTAATVSAGSATNSVAVSPVTPAVGASAGVAVAARDPERDFGLTEAQKQQRVPEEAPKPPQETASIETTVTIVSTRRTGEFVYALANGQVWVQSEANQNGYLRDGSSVTIKRAALGSYKLVSDTVSTRVRRLQ